MSNDAFLRHVPQCAQCLGFFGPGDHHIGFSYGTRYADGQVIFSNVRYYHVLCAPRNRDGSAYPANTITKIMPP